MSRRPSPCPSRVARSNRSGADGASAPGRKETGDGKETGAGSDKTQRNFSFFDSLVAIHTVSFFVLPPPSGVQDTTCGPVDRS